MAGWDLPDIYARALGLGHIYIRQIPPGHGITVTHGLRGRTFFRKFAHMH